MHQHTTGNCENVLGKSNGSKTNNIKNGYKYRGKKHSNLNEVYIPRMRQVMSSTMRGTPEASNMSRLLLVSVFVKNDRWSRLSRLSRLSLGETRRCLSAAHVSLFQHKIKTHQCQSPAREPRSYQGR